VSLTIASPGGALARQDSKRIFLDGPVRIVAPPLKAGVVQVSACTPETRHLHAVIVIEMERPGIADGPFYGNLSQIVC
jgi:hypothetical protein